MKSLFDTAFETIQELFRTFGANKHAYLGPDYPEAQARKDFIDKFFIALGWDVNHDIQKNPYEQEVKVEPPVAVGATQRHADYAFRLAPNFHQVRFFVEAKKPSAIIATEENYFQVIRYGWNSQTPFAVLTDFHQFHVLDCRYKPDPDTALNRAVATYPYTEYTDREKFARIYWVFSREAVANGSLEKRAAELPKPHGKAVQRGLFPGAYKPVDESFLEELDEFRSDLARAFKTTDPHLDSETLTELTQRTLDRLVFLRFLEDRGIEIQRLIDKFGSTSTLWEDFIATSRRLDGIYNGIVFKSHIILDAPSFKVDDSLFSEICERLASVNTPYDFNSIPLHILGSIYERFLGKVIFATPKRVRVEEKPDVRKAGGVYYTPEYICRYIVANTVGKLIVGRTPDEIATLRFADIACGSGSFLLCIYDLLLQHHGSYYNALTKAEQMRAMKRGECIEREGKLYLSLRKKREILLNNIYGVDIDTQAVEVAQLSLYLRLLKEETTVSTHQYLLDFQHIAQMKKLLPDLSKNIVCGNSLIGRDILDGQLFPSDQELKLNPMNFEDAFPEVMKSGGFDAVIGNPPWVKAGLLVDQKPYFQTHYKTFSGNADLYVFFVERALTILKATGHFGYVVSNKWLRADYGKTLREYLSRDTNILSIVDFGELPVFQGVGTFPCLILCTHRSDPPLQTLYTPIKSLPPEGDIAGQIAIRGFSIDLTDVKNTKWTLSPRHVENILVKIRAIGVLLGVYCEGRIRRGVLTGYNPAFLIDKATRDRLVGQSRSAAEVILPFVSGDEVRRYSITWNGRYVILTRHGIDIRQYPSVAEHLAQYRKHLEPKKNPKDSIGRKPGNYRWYEIQDATAYYRDFELPKIIYGQFQIAPHFCFTSSPMCFGSNHYMIVSEEVQSLLYLCGILNSRLYFFYMKRVAGILGDADEGGRLISQKSHILEFPVRRIDPKNSAYKARHDEMVTKVEAMMEAKKQMAAAKTDKGKIYYENKCTSLDRQIDRIVYDLYGLTKDEIKLVEGAEGNHDRTIGGGGVS